jgi:CubicO group peptidase (beta-lactamase class C family)
VVEGIEGKPLEEIVDAYVLEPLGMEHSSMVWREAYAKTMANGHSLYGTREEFRRRRQANSAASLYTTAGDYARFVCAVLDGKRLEREPETVSSLGGSLDYDVAIFPPPLGMTQQREVHHPIPIG